MFTLRRKNVAARKYNTWLVFLTLFSTGYIISSPEVALEPLPAARRARAGRNARPARGRRQPPAAQLGNVSKPSKVKILQKIANFWRARSRLYQNEILRENMRLTAFSSSIRCAHFCTAAIFTF